LRREFIADGGEHSCPELRDLGTGEDLATEVPKATCSWRSPTVLGGRSADRQLAPLEVPASYHRVPALEGDPTGPAFNVAHACAQLLDDITTGTRLVPDFDHAARRRQTLQSLLDVAGEPWSTQGA
jgi:hypothetical protein